MDTPKQLITLIPFAAAIETPAALALIFGSSAGVAPAGVMLVAVMELTPFALSSPAADVALHVAAPAHSTNRNRERRDYTIRSAHSTTTITCEAVFGSSLQQRSR